MIKLAPSILSADFGRLAEQLNEVETAGAQLIHVDVMDGHFVPNITVGPIVVKAVKRYTKLPLNTHLMIDDPGKYIDVFAGSGATLITIHQEIAGNIVELIKKIKSAGAMAGLAINPETAVDVLTDIIGQLDSVTVMSVHPGFGGQTFIPTSLEKIQAVRRLISDKELSTMLEVDGGITRDNVTSVIEAGASAVVAGSAIFGASDAKVEVKRFLSLISIAENFL